MKTDSPTWTPQNGWKVFGPRRLVMGQRIEEEVEAVLDQIGRGVAAAGFYSYGEICPSGLVPSCDLPNQTMTLTVFTKAA